ncbi:hypothetical protein D1007_45860 [Hordeum vulgare]|nr:hypothetical protein D1007_45860 [Hordeum vulgare]
MYDERRDQEDGSRGRTIGARHGKRGMYLMLSKLVWDLLNLAILDRDGEMEDAQTPVPDCLLVGCRDIDGLGLDSLHFPAHPFVFDEHRGVTLHSEERLHFVFSKEEKSAN